MKPESKPDLTLRWLLLFSLLFHFMPLPRSPVNAISFPDRDAISARFELPTIAALTAFPREGLVDGQAVQVLGYYASGDGGGGVFRWSAAAADTANSGTVFAPDAGAGRWLRVFDGAINVRWFGAKGDGLADDTACMQAALDYLETANGGALYLPRGRYIFSALSYVALNGRVQLRGDGWQNTASDSFGSANWTGAVLGSVLVSTATSGVALTLSSIAGCGLTDLALLGPGAGTAKGVFLTSGNDATQGAQFSNVLIANFALGFEAPGMYEAQWNSVQFRGCTNCAKFTTASNNNVFINCQAEQFTGKGFWFNACRQNTFIGGLLQSHTGTGIYGEALGIGSLTISGVWFESQAANTYAIQLLGGDHSLIEGCVFSGVSAITTADRVNLDGAGFTKCRANRTFNGVAIYGDTQFGTLSDNSLPFDNATVTASGGCHVDGVGAGSPEGVVSANKGSTWRRTDGGAGTCFYVKEGTTGNVGWVAK